MTLKTMNFHTSFLFRIAWKRCFRKSLPLIFFAKQNLKEFLQWILFAQLKVEVVLQPILFEQERLMV